MSTSVEPTNQEPTNQEPPNPPSSPEPSPTDKELADLRSKNNLLVRALASTNDVINRKDAELESIRAPKPATRTREESAKAFFEDPVTETMAIVEQALTKEIRPFRSFIERQERNEQLDTFINQAKSNQAFAGKWNAGIEQYCREHYHELNPINEGSFMTMVIAGFGLQNLGLIAGAPAPVVADPRNDRRSNIDPPNVPTSRGNPHVEPKKRYRDLTEDEARYARECKMTKEEYLDMLDEAADKVATSSIGKPPAPAPTNGGK